MTSFLDRLERMLGSPTLSMVCFALMLAFLKVNVFAAVCAVIVFANYTARIEAAEKYARDRGSKPLVETEGLDAKHESPGAATRQSPNPSSVDHRGQRG